MRKTHRADEHTQPRNAERLLWAPDLADTSIGTTEWFQRQAAIITDRPLVKQTYELWYGLMLADAASVPGEPLNQILEIGSGSGYLKAMAPQIVTSDIIPGNADLVIDAQKLPFDDHALRAVFLTHVFHHIPDVTLFLDEASRTLVPGGVISMIEVAHTPLSRLLFRHFHPEAYDPHVKNWQLDTEGPCGGANQALSWIVFKRDQEKFRSLYPQFAIEEVRLLPWLGYLLSGGASRKNLVPDSAAGAVAAAERALAPFNPLCALHWHIRLRKHA